MNSSETQDGCAIARSVERELQALLPTLPALSELPIASLRDVDDLVRLDLALLRLQSSAPSGERRALIRVVRGVLARARAQLRQVTVPSSAPVP